MSYGKLMAVMVPREKWADERLDALNRKVDNGFARLDGDIKDLRQDMNARFNAVDARFDRIDTRFDKIEDRMFRGAVAIIVAMVGAAGAIVAALIAVNA